MWLPAFYCFLFLVVVFNSQRLPHLHGLLPHDAEGQRVPSNRALLTMGVSGGETDPSVATPSVSNDSGIVMDVNITTLTQDRGEWVEVTWHGVPDPSTEDWVAMFLPAGALPDVTRPSKWKVASLDIDGTHLQQGKGRLRFRLINYRTSGDFAFVRGGSNKEDLAGAVIMARSKPFHPANVNTPMQRRLALTGDNTQMWVQWTTHNSSSPIIKWGTEPGVLIHTMPATSSTYTAQEMCGPPATTTGWLDPGTFHSVLLTGLQPSKQYYYIVGDEEWGFTSEASFHAAPEVGPKTSVKLLAVADLGQTEEDQSKERYDMRTSAATTGYLQQDVESGAGYQLLVHGGDTSYAMGYGSQWDNYMLRMEPIISRIPKMVIPGNHDRDDPNSGDRFNVTGAGGECGVPFERRFNQPRAGPDKPWYSFDFGPIHFLMYSTEHHFDAGTEQHRFILSDLAAVNRNTTPWLVVVGHRPIYISSQNYNNWSGDQAPAQALRETYEEAFVQYKVDLTLHSHHHSYQRSCPASSYQCLAAPAERKTIDSSTIWSSQDQEYALELYGSDDVYVDAPAPVHIVHGSGGSPLSTNVQFEHRPTSIWQAVRLTWGYLRMEATGSQLKCEAVNVKEGRVMDSITLIKTEQWSERKAVAV